MEQLKASRDARVTPSWGWLYGCGGMGQDMEGYGGIWMDEERAMLPMTCFGVWGLSLSMATITTSVGFKVILRRTERLRWATWATMGGLAHEHIGHRARSPFGHRDGVPPVCPYCLSARLPLVSL